MIKVLWFTNTPCLGASYLNLDINGGGWLNSIDAAIQNKVELHIAFTHPHNTPAFSVGKSHYHPIYTGNIYVNNLKSKLFINSVSDKVLSKYLSVISEVNPDIIHIHGTENQFGCIIEHCNKPIILSIQGILSVITHKYCSGFEYKYLFNRLNGNLSLSKLLFSDTHWIYHYLHDKQKAKIESTLLPSFRYIIGRTDWDRRVTRVLAPKSVYFHVGEIMRDGFYENRWVSHGERNKLYIHTTNANSYYKGFETLCHTLNLLNNIGLEVEWSVAGISKNSPIVNLTKKKLGKLYPVRGLNLMGNLNETELINAMLNADMYVMTSHIENSPNNLCEAMLLGMPCIATFAGGTSSLLEDKKSGLLIQDGDPWSMAGAIQELYSSPDLAKVYGENARNGAIKRHDKHIVENQLLEVYEIVFAANN